MNDTFYRAIRAQKNLDKFNPERHWPIGYTQPPTKQAIKIATLYGTGTPITKIMSELNLTRDSVMAVVRRCRRHSEK